MGRWSALTPFERVAFRILRQVHGQAIAEHYAAECVARRQQVERNVSPKSLSRPRERVGA